MGLSKSFIIKKSSNKNFSLFSNQYTKTKKKCVFKLAFTKLKINLFNQTQKIKNQTEAFLGRYVWFNLSNFKNG